MGLGIASAASTFVLFDGLAGFDARVVAFKELFQDEGLVAALGSMGPLWIVFVVGVVIAGLLFLAGL
jgi:hypothetical protein